MKKVKKSTLDDPDDDLSKSETNLLPKEDPENEEEEEDEIPEKSGNGKENRKEKRKKRKSGVNTSQSSLREFEDPNMQHTLQGLDVSAILKSSK